MEFVVRVSERIGRANVSEQITAKITHLLQKLLALYVTNQGFVETFLYVSTFLVQVQFWIFGCTFAYDLVRFRHKKHLVRLWKRSRSGLKKSALISTNTLGLPKIIW